MAQQRFKKLISRIGEIVSNPIFTFFLAFSIYLFVAWFTLPADALWSPDEGAKLWQVRSFRWEDNRMNYDIFYAGRDIDPKLKFALSNTIIDLLRVRGTKLYFQRMPVFPVLTLPLYRLFGVYGIYILPAFAGALVSVLSLQLIKSEDRRLIMWLVIAFASPIFIYSTMFWEHTLAASFGIAGALLALQTKPIQILGSITSVLSWVIIGILFGAGAYIRQELVIFALAFLVIYWLLTPSGRGGALWATLTLAFILIPFPVIHGALFNNESVPTNAEYLYRPFSYLKMAHWSILPDLLFGPINAGSIAPGWLGWIWTISAIIAIITSFCPSRWTPARIIKVICLGITAIAGIAFLFTPKIYQSAHGLLLTTPWALLGITRAREIWQQGEEQAKIVAGTALLGLMGYVIGIVILRGDSPHGGLEWGARFAIPFYTLLALIACWDWGKNKSDLEIVIIWILIILGFGFQIRGIWTIQQDKQNNVTLYQTIQQLPEEHVTYEAWWMPLNSATVDIDKAFYVTDTPEDMANWIELAVQNEVWDFSTVTITPSFIEQTDEILDDYELTVNTFQQSQYFEILQVKITPK